MDDFFKEVKAAFPIYPIPSFDLVYGYKISSEESYEELILLEGKEWTLIESNYLQNHYTFPFWLSISGLHYYLPAIMIFSWNEYMNKKDIVLVADSAALATWVPWSLPYFSTASAEGTTSASASA